MTPEEYKRKALEQMSTAKNPWDRGQEAGLNEVSGLDLLREPKALAMDAVGPGNVQSLIDMLVPEDLPIPALKGAKLATMGSAAAMGVIKPKTRAKDLMSAGMHIWDKDKIAAEIADKLGGDKAIPMWKKKLMQPKD